MASGSKNRGTDNIFLAFKKFLAPLVIVASVIIFFLSYNTYLVDHSLEDLKFALDQTATAQNIGDAEKINVVLDDLLMNEVASPKAGSGDMAMLEFAKNIVSKGRGAEQLKDIEFLLGKLEKGKEQKRGSMLLAFDRMNTDLQSFIKFITQKLPGGVPGPEMFRPAAKADLSLLDTAKDYKDNWKLKEAISVYEDFIGKYPFYEGLRSVKLQLADSYFQSMNYKEAKRLYEKVIREAPHSSEAKAANCLLTKVEDRVKKQAERERLRAGLEKFKTTPELAQAYYNIGVLDAYLFDVSSAQKSFKKVIELAPGTELAQRAEFNLAWCLKFSARYNEAAAGFAKFVEKYPDSPLAAGSAYLIADSYYKAGRFEEAAAQYERISAKFADSPAAEISQFQAGYTYLHDLHDPFRAAEAFKKLKALYPAADITNYAELNMVPAVERSYRTYGFILLKEGKLNESKEAFNKSLAVNKDDGWTYCGLGTANALLILPDEGINMAREGIKRTSDEYTHAAAGFAYDLRKSYNKAAEEYKLSLLKDPGYVVSHYNLGRDYMIVGDYGFATQELKEAIRLIPNLASAHNNLGCSYWYRGNMLEAEAAFKSAISYKKDLAEAQYNLGILYEACEKYSKARDCFNETISIMPDLKEAKRHLEIVQEKIKIMQ